MDNLFTQRKGDLLVGVNDHLWHASAQAVSHHLATEIPIISSLENLLEMSTTYLRPGDFILLYMDAKVFIYLYHAPETVLLRTPAFGIAPARTTLPKGMSVYMLLPAAMAYFRELALVHATFTFDERTSVKRLSDEATEASHHNFGSSFEAALSATSVDKEARSRTPAARSLHKIAATSLSLEPEQVLTTGIFITYQRILHPTSMGAISHSWGMVGPLMCQLQPGHVLELVSNWSALPLDYFASMDEWLGSVEAKAKSDVFARISAIEVDTSLLIDATIIGSDINRFSRALMNYGFVLDTIFQFRLTIRQSLVAVFQRLVGIVRPRVYSQRDPRSKGLIEYVGRYAMIELQRIYGSVFASSTTVVPEDVIVDRLNEIPDMSPNSDFTNTLGYIHANAVPGTTKVLKAETEQAAPGPSKRALKKQRQEAATHKATTASKAAAQQTGTAAENPTGKGKGVCGYFLSATGCKKADCTRLHRSPKPDEAANVLHFFSKNPKMEQVKF